MLFRNQLSSLGNLESSFIHCSQSELSFFTLTRRLKFRYIPKITAPLWHFFVYELQIPQLTHPKIFFQNGWLSIVIVFLLVFFFPLNYMWILNLYLKLFVPFLWFLYLKLFHLSFFLFFFSWIILLLLVSISPLTDLSPDHHLCICYCFDCRFTVKWYGPLHNYVMLFLVFCAQLGTGDTSWLFA